MEGKNTAQAGSVHKDIFFVKRDSEEWSAMWDGIANHPINKGLTDPYAAFHGGECWQYMESVVAAYGPIHRFRHRLHPATKRIERIEIRASDGYKVEPSA